MKAGGKRDGNGGKLAVAIGAIDRTAMARGHVDDGAVIAEQHPPPPIPIIGPNGPPAGVVEKGIGDDPRGLGEVVRRDLADSVRLRTYVRVVHWRRQGDLGELSAMEWFASKGAGVYFPIGHSPHSDFVAEFGNQLTRVQVKSSTCFRMNRWQVTLCTRGGNQSWSGVVKYFDPAFCDWLFVVVGDGRRWCIPSSAIQGGRGICLGGPKYAEFEVESGHPLPPRDDQEPASTIVSLDPRGDVRAAKGVAL
jgi:hypothetical protein